MKEWENGEEDLPEAARSLLHVCSKSQAVSLGQKCGLTLRLAQNWGYSPRNATLDAERHAFITSRLDYAKEQRA